MKNKIKIVASLLILILFVSCKCKETSVSIVDSSSLKAYKVDLDKLEYIYEDTTGNSRTVFVKYNKIEPSDYPVVNNIITKEDSAHVWFIWKLELQGELSDCSMLFTNQIKSHNLYSNNAFSYKNIRYPANTNMLEFGLLLETLPLFVNPQYNNDELRIIMSHDFLKYGSFPSDQYTFRFEAETDDGILIMDEITLKLK